MKLIRLALSGLLLASTIPLHAQVVASPSAPAVKPEVSCPCDSSQFKPLNDKARSVAEYWSARRKYSVARTISTTAVLFALLSNDGGLINEAENSLSKSFAELHAARTKAVRLAGIKVINNDDSAVEILLEKGVDYTLTP